MKEHDKDGHGGCIATCRTCEVTRLRAAFTQLDEWLDSRRDAPDVTTLGLIQRKIRDVLGAK